MRTRRPDSNAHAIADKLAGGAPPYPGRSNRAERRLRKTSIRRGPVVGNYVTPTTNNRFGPQSVTAAAEIVYSRNLAKQPKRPPVASWQEESWQLRDEVPEFRFAGDRVARGASQYKLFAAKRPDVSNDEPERIDDGLAYELCTEMFGDIAGTQQAIHRAAQQLSFNGDSLIVVSEGQNGFSWQSHSVNELTGQGKAWKLNTGIESRNLTEDDLVIRCWKPSPKYQALADSPARAVLPVARTLRGLSRRASAEIDSRLAGAGMLLVPSEIQVISAGEDADPNEDVLSEELADSMIIPIQNPDSAGAVVPFIFRGPAEHLKEIRHISFATPLDERLAEMETSSIRRIALGMDSPPETLLGMNSVNHWTGWLISSEEVTLVLSPTVATICHALTVGWLHPMLEASGVEDWADYLIWFDASELELRPDKSSDSRELHAKEVLSDAAMLRENGFSEKDAPTPEETRRRLLTKLVLADTTLAAKILPELGIDLGLIEPTQAPHEKAGATVTAPPPEPKAEQTIPEKPTEQPNDNVETGPGE